MTTILGYTFEADYHCINCTRERFPQHEGRLDQWGVAEDSYDQEGNIVHPVFSSDSAEESIYCVQCGDIIKEVD